MKRRRGERGSSLIEGALALLLLLLLTLAIVDVGRYLYAANLLPYLAREGARFVSLHGPEVEQSVVQKHVRRLAAGLPPDSVQVDLTIETGAPAVTVRTQWTFTPAAGLLLGQNVPVSGQARLPLRGSAPARVRGLSE
jgi:Flp pilus assembly protein TadG